MFEEVNSTEVLRPSGGNAISADVVPYMAVVLGQNTGSVCTATLLALDILITTARCFYKGNVQEETISSIRVLSGVTTLSNLSVSGDVQERQVEKLIIHPNFKPSSKDSFFGYNDLALILLKTAFQETGSVRAVEVGYLKWYDITSIKCSVVSYGAVNPLTVTQEDDSLKMTEVTATTVNCRCKESLKTHFGQRISRWICLDPDKSGPIPCVGGAGAGLFCNGKLIALNIGLIPFEDLSHCHYLHHNTLTCQNKQSLSIFLDLCPFMPWFQYSVSVKGMNLPRGPINCSKASQWGLTYCYFYVVTGLLLLL